MPSVVKSSGQLPVTGATISFTLSSSPTAGNILLAFCAYSQFGGARTIATPAGWAKIDDKSNGLDDTLAWFWRLVKPGDGTAYSFTVSNGTDNVSGSMLEISGADLITPVNQSGYTAIGVGTITTATTATLTPNVVGCLAVACLASDSSASSFSSVSTGWTELQSMSGNYHPSFTASKNALTADTSTGINVTFTLTGSHADDEGVTAIVLIAPSTNSGAGFLGLM